MTDEEAEKEFAAQKARFEAVPVELRAAILDVMKRHDGDDFSVGDDDNQLADFLDDLSRNGLEIVWKK